MIVMSCGPFNGNSRLIESRPASQAREKSITFRKLKQCVDNLAIHQSEVACISRNRTVSNRIKYSIEAIEQKPLARAFLPIDSLRIDNVVTTFPLIKKSRDRFRIILQIRIHHNDNIA